MAASQQMLQGAKDPWHLQATALEEALVWKRTEVGREIQCSAAGPSVAE